MKRTLSACLVALWAAGASAGLLSGTLRVVGDTEATTVDRWRFRLASPGTVSFDVLSFEALRPPTPAARRGPST